MCGFRIAKGGTTERYGIMPDMVTMGKIIGGGMPVGAFGGKKEIMAMVAPEGPVYQAGTLSGNPIAMRCGLTLLKELHETAAIYQELEEKTAYLEKGIRKVFDKHQLHYCLNRVGSMMSFHFDIDGQYLKMRALMQTSSKTISWCIEKRVICLQLLKHYLFLQHTPTNY